MKKSSIETILTDARIKERYTWLIAIAKMKKIKDWWIENVSKRLALAPWANRFERTD